MFDSSQHLSGIKESWCFDSMQMSLETSVMDSGTIQRKEDLIFGHLFVDI